MELVQAASELADARQVGRARRQPKLIFVLCRLLLLSQQMSK
jgi:hypothetical protein